MKILILDNIFNRSYWYLSKTHTKLLEHYSKRKLIRFLKNLTKNQENNLKLKIISNRNYISHIGSKIEGSIDFELLSDYRIKLDRNEFLKIKRITNESTKKVIIQLFKNLIDLNFFISKASLSGN